MIHKTITILILLFVLNCKSTQSQINTEKESMVLVGKGNLYGSGEEGLEKQNIVITDSNQWNDLLKKMNSVNNVSSSFSETEINFSNYTLIAVFDSVKSTAGHSIELDMNTNSETIEINVNYNAPEDMAATVMTQPYYLVKIAKSDLPIVFK